jgi:hypothetical protein
MDMILTEDSECPGLLRSFRVRTSAGIKYGVSGIRNCRPWIDFSASVEMTACCCRNEGMLLL